jgi:hypothetical protein
MQFTKQALLTDLCQQEVAILQAKDVVSDGSLGELS